MKPGRYRLGDGCGSVGPKPMNMPIDTLAFAESFEQAGFPNGQARALAAAFGRAHDSTREGLVTTDHLDIRLAEMEARLTKQLSDNNAALAKQLSDNNAALTKQIGDNNAALTRQIADVDTALAKQMGDNNAALTRQIADVDTALTKQIADGDMALAKQIADVDTTLTKQIADVDTALTKQIADGDMALAKQIADNGRDISGRLWSTVSIIAGVSTAVSATIGAGIALLFKLGGL